MCSLNIKDSIWYLQYVQYYIIFYIAEAVEIIQVHLLWMKIVYVQCSVLCILSSWCAGLHNIHYIWTIDSVLLHKGMIYCTGPSPIGAR